MQIALEIAKRIASICELIPPPLTKMEISYLLFKLVKINGFLIVSHSSFTPEKKDSKSFLLILITPDPSSRNNFAT